MAQSESNPAFVSGASRPGPEIIIIAAVAERNRVIGRGLDLPWHIPEDLKRFKRLTLGHPLIMGRNTFDSLVHQFGRPLPERRNIVVSTTGAWPEFPDVTVCSSLSEALASLKGEPRIYIGGGGTIYTQCLPMAHRLELTLVKGEYEGDTFFPPFEHLIGSVFFLDREEAKDGFRFVSFVRKEIDQTPRSASQ